MINDAKKYESDPVMMLGGVLLFSFVFFLLALGYAIWYFIQN
jgi:hypothetical protein